MCKKWSRIFPFCTIIRPNPRITRSGNYRHFSSSASETGGWQEDQDHREYPQGESRKDQNGQHGFHQPTVKRVINRRTLFATLFLLSHTGRQGGCLRLMMCNSHPTVKRVSVTAVTVTRPSAMFRSASL